MSIYNRILKIKYTLTLIFLLLFSSMGNAEDTITGEDSIRGWDPILLQMDYLIALKLIDSTSLVTDTSLLNIYGFSPDEVPTYADSVVAARVKELDIQTTINLVYNPDVKRFIELYANRRRQQVSRMLGLSALYYPLFEEMLDKYELPLELKHLAVVESALNPIARSRAGAKGLWQFMYRTGKMYDLKSTTLTDDRFDPILATDAACRHMLDLYEIFGDWSLVLAAYNAGAGNVRRAIKRSGGKFSYWGIQPFLPRETRGYVPAFIAVNYIMNYSAEHNIYPVHPGILYGETDTFRIKEVLAFDQITELIGVPIEYLELLNPAYTKGIIPATANKQYTLRLPVNYSSRFLAYEDSVYYHKTSAGLEHDKLVSEAKKAEERIIHVVRSGESLGLIANKYGCSVYDLKAWNDLRGNTIYPRQRLVVYNRGSKPRYIPTANKINSSSSEYHTVKRGETLSQIASANHCQTKDIKQWNGLNNDVIKPGQKLRVKPKQKNTSGGNKSSGKTVYYTVRSGDTLWDIAKKYKGVSANDIKQANNIRSDRRLKPGQKLKIPLAS